jgi:thiol-disulfide isomerase/thioredoxin/ribosomal protein S17E
VPLAINYGQHLNISGNSFKNLKVTGSSDTNLLNEYEKFRNESLNRLVKSVRTEIKNLKKDSTTINDIQISKLREKEVDNYKIHLQELTGFVSKNMRNSIALYATSIRWNSENIDIYKELVSNFELKYPNISITKKLKEKVDLLEKTNIGSILENIEMPTINGETLSLNSVKLKYTLVDFWASWCPPCRTESKLLNELYLEYNKAGFEVFGISLDNSDKRWLNALEMDNRVWPNVSSLDGFNTKAAKNLGITALPTNFLIDSTGKIIAVNIHGEALKEKIENLFK